MSNIYIQEPPTHGKVLLETTAGEIDIELWSKEAPKACRNFIQLCLEGYYDGTVFHRLVPKFIVQGGDPTGTGRGGASIWGKPFKDEIHSRLRFNRRGLVAMANAGRNDNGSQFFFTLAETPELQNKHTIFGKVAGNTIFNMIKLEESPVDEDERPIYIHKILKTKVLSNPFDDIVPRGRIKRESRKEKKSSVTGTKNYKLLSFGEEAEEDEEAVLEVNRGFTGKGKSSHDLTNDPKLSTEPAVTAPTPTKESSSPDAEDEDPSDSEEKLNELTAASVRDKLKRADGSSNKAKGKGHTTSKSTSTSHKPESRGQREDDDEDEEGDYYLGKADDKARAQNLQMLREEFKNLKREMRKTEKLDESKLGSSEAVPGSKDHAKLESAKDNNIIQDFLSDQKKYKEINLSTKKKGTEREAQTLALLSKFQKKIESAKEQFGELGPPPGPSDPEVEEAEEVDGDISWLAQKLHYEEKDPVLAKDASLKSDDWFEIYDPRNPLTKRRREGNEKASAEQFPSKRDKKRKV